MVYLLSVGGHGTSTLVYWIRQSEGLPKAHQRFLKPLQAGIGMISFTHVMRSFLLLDINDDSNEFFQHFALRFWLWRTGSLPWNLVAFLDEATERLLLRKVGGGYIFVHRLLLDHFASLP